MSTTVALAPLPSRTPPPKLLDRVRELARTRGHGETQAATFVECSRAFILFHDRQHPKEMGRPEIARYLEHVVGTAKEPLVALSTCRSALEFLYRQVLQINLGELPLPQPPRLLDQARQKLRVKHYAPRTEHCYTQWMRRFIHFHGKRHPRDLGAEAVEQFLTDLAVNGRVSASTQNQALDALVFLYEQVLGIRRWKWGRPSRRRGGCAGRRRGRRRGRPA